MFDPFGDFADSGYLRNNLRLKDPSEIKSAEHLFFLAGIEEAVEWLSRVRGPITYEHYKRVHITLFGDFYPWAGKDRYELGVAPHVHKGGVVEFESSERILRAMEYGLRLGNKKSQMKSRPGDVLQNFAWAHPFLDGNGRTMLLVVAELAYRAGYWIDWSRSNKADYLKLLTDAISTANSHDLDQYLLGLSSAKVTKESWIDHFKNMPGLDGSDDEKDTAEYSAYGPGGPDRYQEVRKNRNDPF